MNILVVEDEKELSNGIVDYLRAENYLCEVAADYSHALSKIDVNDYDCVLIDLGLPDGNGLDLVRELKENNKQDGVIIISAKNAIDDKITGLNIGADDYMAKPFHLSELSARIASVIRRKVFNGSSKIEFNEITIDTNSKEVTIDEVQVELTRKEFQLLLYLVVSRNRVVSKNAIARHLWGDDMDTGESFDFIYTHIKNLRRKLADAGCPDYLKAVYGMGYKFTDK